MSKLGDAQREFVQHQGQLIAYAYENGMALTTGDGYRDPRVFGMLGVFKGYGNRNSNHKRRLAHDWNLFIDGEYQDENDAHKPLGDFWESLHPENRWGGRYGDGNHYERVLGGWR